MGEPFGVEYRIVDSWGKAFYEDRAGRPLTEWYVAHETASEMDEVYPDYAPHRVEARTVCPWMPCATGGAA
jgi:hypothetical protein